MPPEIEIMILRLLQVEDLLKLFDDKTFQPRVMEEFSRRLTITLALFVPDVQEFRHLMRQTEALVGGAVGLWFTTSMPASWRPDCLDLLVPTGATGRVKEFLLKVPGSALFPSTDLRSELTANWYYSKYSFCVWTTRGIVRVVPSMHLDPLAVVPYYWGTHLMNVLSADAFVAPYMRLTMAGRAIGVDVKGAIGVDETEDGQDDGSAPYDPRGFTLHKTGAEFANLQGGCYNFVACCQRQRWFTDEETVLVQIERGREKDVFETFRRCRWGWMLRVDPCANKSCFFSRDFTVEPSWLQALSVSPHGGM